MTGTRKTTALRSVDGIDVGEMEENGDSDERWGLLL
jgi:hypothetical protein